MLERIATVYQRYGFDPLETSAVETVEALGKFLPDVDRPTRGFRLDRRGAIGWLCAMI
jgi:histidyl-tRNA synthetase